MGEQATEDMRHPAPWSPSPPRVRAHRTKAPPRCVLLLVVELLEDGLLQTLGLGGGGPAALDLAVAADEELLEVPLDPLQAHEARLLVLEPLVEWVGLIAVDVDLAKDREAHAIVDLAEALDLLVGAGVLATELVAGEAKNDKVVRVLLLEALVELLEALELGGEAALGGGVDDQNDLALVLLKGLDLAALCGWGSQIVSHALLPLLGWCLPRW